MCTFRLFTIHVAQLFPICSQIPRALPPHVSDPGWNLLDLMLGFVHLQPSTTDDWLGIFDCARGMTLRCFRLYRAPVIIHVGRIFPNKNHPAIGSSDGNPQPWAMTSLDASDPSDPSPPGSLACRLPSKTPAEACSLRAARWRNLTGGSATN